MKKVTHAIINCFLTFTIRNNESCIQELLSIILFLFLFHRFEI